jgi:hypothetical protein
MSSVRADPFTPPNAVSWGEGESFRKLYTELPPRVWALARKPARRTRTVRKIFTDEN